MSTPTENKALLIESRKVVARAAGIPSREAKPLIRRLADALVASEAELTEIKALRMNELLGLGTPNSASNKIGN